MPDQCQTGSYAADAGCMNASQELFSFTPSNVNVWNIFISVMQLAPELMRKNTKLK